MNENKTNINWYPGHMAKTKREIIQDLKLIDVVVEILDARIPRASHNPDIGELVKNKKKVIVLNKSDLAEEKESKNWVKSFENDNVSAVLADCNLGKGIDEVIRKVKDLMKDKLEKDAQKGKVGGKIRILVLGIPNVGKSSFINRATKKVSAKVGNKPGITRQKQWIKLDSSIELLDTPGVLWPKLDTEEVALNLAYTGTIKDDIVEKTELSYSLLGYLMENYPENVKTRYKLDQLEEKEDGKNIVLEQMEIIGKKRGAIVSGGRVDLEKTSNIILEDFRSGKFGKITLEKVREK